MNKKAVKIIAFIIILTMILTSFSFVLFLPSAFADTKEGRDTNSQEYLEEQLAVLENYLEFIKKYYKDDIDYNMLMDGAFEGATGVLGDPFSVYYSKAEDGESFAEAVTGEFGGIGVGLQESETGQHQITTVYEGSPAEKAGIQIGDIVVKIDSKDVTAMSLNDMVLLMRGEENTKVNVTITRSGAEKTFTITRAIIEAKCVSHKMLENNIGYMKITSFDSNVAEEYAAARAALIKSGAKSLILDLRDNGGGLINGAVAIARDMINTGDITHYERQGKIIGSEKATGTASASMPTVALVNENSASATEILAGALQDNKAAKLVGATTYGKGIAQQFMTLSSGDTAKVSILYFLTPNKKVIDHVGITPDYVVRNGSLGDEKAKASYTSFAPMNEQTKPKAGETGLNVYAAQQRLALLGYYTGETTAVMDDATVAAIKKFQKDENLYPYGVLDYTTRNKLETEAYNLAYGTVNGDADYQLEKAIELLR
ncbi:S41 family peptidase [Clostridium aminobutyricum]|uniref:S41 family peptidase n=1 Tax=Clostridium aminobutyricum TaxID=33953 RepID=A0A939D9Z0_CLOAM|nr:S41 family peptidase [Clostridium aminobutyricum]MBN7774114.1 S41 family peptidase [Clostridium aminobutyricum]